MNNCVVYIIMYIRHSDPLYIIVYMVNFIHRDYL